MGITIVLENEDGTAVDTVYDPHDVLHRILPRDDTVGFQYLNCIDWYGDTVFNRLQAPLLLAELERLQFEVGDADAEKMIAALRGLAMQLKDGTHVYLKFYGD